MSRQTKSISLQIALQRLKQSATKTQIRIDRASVWDVTPTMRTQEKNNELSKIRLERGERLPKGAYVLSEDIAGRMRAWAAASRYTIPAGALNRYTSMVTTILEKAFSSTQTRVAVTREESTGRQGARCLSEMKRAREGRVGVIALDPIFTSSADAVLSLTRLAGKDGTSLNSLGERPGAPALQTQLKTLSAKFTKAGIREVIIADDVMFSGSQMAAVTALLESQGLTVVGIFANIATDESFSKLQDLYTSTNKSVDVRSLYSGDVLDIIDLRDFLPGATDGGRTIAGKANTGMPYLYPFGQPVKWASLPEARAREASKALLEAALELYLSIEKASNKQLRLKDLPRGIYNPATQEDTSRSVEPVTVWLARCIQTLS